MKVAKACSCMLAVTFCASALASEKMPIIGWGAWDEKGASAERYAEARDAGFTHLTQWWGTWRGGVRQLRRLLKGAPLPLRFMRRTPQPRPEGNSMHCPSVSPRCQK